MNTASTTAANTLLNASRPRSPRVSGGPRRPREVVLPTPLAGSLLSGEVVSRLDAVAQEMETPQQSPPQSVQPPPRPTTTPPQRVRSPMNWLRSRFMSNRTVSNMTVPNIDIEPPSHTPTTASNRTSMNPVLLTPDVPNSLPALPQELVSESRQGSAGIYSNPPSRTGDRKPITIVLPDNQLPPGFVPYTPVVRSPISPVEYRPYTPIASNSSSPVAFSPIPSIANTNRLNYSGSESSRSQPQSSNGVPPMPDPFSYPASPVTRPSTAAAMRSPTQESNARKRVMSLGVGLYSPAPLNRPISIFSDS
ncbi:hypothetical protein BDQ12DRAFT_263008 [Crucibulum laeve]|uniref:Uncharacterized protein n=1 Tax=Crucibulum laeve TaxID=68775 RepID=A0A5C3LVR3_9AGAR|nr:hypothetical protein BDQ12DRAFT_263008 [Crucibulum laeve]